MEVLQIFGPGLITLVKQGYKIHNQFSEYWLVIGVLEAQYRDLRRGYSNWGLVVPPGLKPSRFHVPNRSGFCASFRQGKLGGKNRSNSLVTWAKWWNDAMMTIFFLATYFHNPCSAVYFSLMSSSYTKRKITNVNDVTWTTTFSVHLNTYLRLLTFFFLRGKKKMKVSCQNREWI